MQAAKAAVKERSTAENQLNAVAAGRGLSGKVTNIDVGVSVHCSMKFGPGGGGAGPRFGLKLGPLSCPLAPPPGFLTEEARITPP